MPMRAPWHSKQDMRMGTHGVMARVAQERDRLIHTYGVHLGVVPWYPTPV